MVTDKVGASILIRTDTGNPLLFLPHDSAALAAIPALAYLLFVIRIHLTCPGKQNGNSDRD